VPEPTTLISAEPTTLSIRSSVTNGIKRERRCEASKLKAADDATHQELFKGEKIRARR
jgi:hypothetical protein